jgi:peptidoglycan/LPS O-acetylase OafA/YrhL
LTYPWTELIRCGQLSGDQVQLVLNNFGLKHRPGGRVHRDMDFTAPRPRLPALTSLRFFAALHVVFFHLQAMKIMTNPGWFHDLASIGYVGVSLFFVLSGFILVYTYAGRTTTVREFWRARFARIYPAYLFSLLVTAPWFFIAVLKFDLPFFQWAKAHLKLAAFLEITLLQAWIPPAALVWNVVAWSLSVEAFFYLLFPFLLKAYARMSRVQLICAAVFFWFMTLAISGAYVWRRPDGLAYVDSDTLSAFWLNAVKFHPLARLPEFLMGMACGFLFLRTRANTKLAIPLVLGGVASCAVAGHFSTSIPYPILHTSLLAPAFAAIVYGLALQPRWVAILNMRPMVLLGDASYSLYLLHSMILAIYFFDPKGGGIRHKSPAGILIAIVIVCTVSMLVYRFIEEPARRKLRGKQKERPVPEAGQPPIQPALA